MTAKPVIHCLIARQNSKGRPRKIRRVDLATAYLAMRAGYAVIGPDPEDMQEYDAWLALQPIGPFNPPHA